MAVEDVEGEDDHRERRGVVALVFQGREYDVDKRSAVGRGCYSLRNVVMGCSALWRSIGPGQDPRPILNMSKTHVSYLTRAM